MCTGEPPIFIRRFFTSIIISGSKSHIWRYVSTYLIVPKLCSPYSSNKNTVSLRFSYFYWHSENSMSAMLAGNRVLSNFDGQESKMLRAKFRGNRSAGSREEDFWRVFTIYGRGGHLGHVTQMLRINFRSPHPSRLHIKFGFDWPSGFREEDVWNCWRRRTDAEPWVYYKLTLWA